MRDRSGTQHAKESEEGDGARARAVRNILRDAHRQTAPLPQRLESRNGDAQLKFSRVRRCQFDGTFGFQREKRRLGKGMSCSAVFRVFPAL